MAYDMIINIYVPTNIYIYTHNSHTAYTYN